jgi:hypothetical protein
MADYGIDSRDLEIPKLMLMQPTSGLVGDDRAEVGQIINTLDDTVVGGIDEGAIELVPLMQYKTVRIYDASVNPPKFLRVEPDDGKNSSFEMREGREGDIPVKRVLNMNFFVLAKKEIDSGDEFPAVISFKSTSAQAGRQVATQMLKTHAKFGSPFARSVIVGVKKEKKEKNSWAVFTIEKGNDLDEDSLKVAQGWYEKLKSYNVNVKEENDADEVSVPATQAVAPPTVVGTPEEGPY